MVGRVSERPPDLVILDLMLPGCYGLDVCRDLRPFYAGPILILTAREEDTEQISDDGPVLHAKAS